MAEIETLLRQPVPVEQAETVSKDNTESTRSVVWQK
jgi:hypothetical protein